MKSFDTELKKYSEKIRLRMRERRELRERILSYMEYHPLPKQTEQLQGSIESQPFVLVHLNTIYTRVAAGLAAVLFVVAVPIAAERSVPGDVLYLVKTGLNENIQSQFANSPYEKVALETRFIERRIAEARLLASEGKLTKEVEAAIAEDVREHVNAAQLGLLALRNNNADDAAIAKIVFDSTLEVQSAVLGTSENDSATSSTRNIAEAVRAAQSEALIAKSTSTPSFERLMARVESETTRAHELFGAIDESATVEERNDIERRLADIDRKIVRAQEDADSDPAAAATDLAKALGLIHKLILFMTDIDVRENVALETLVPVELTLEERSEAVQTVLDDVVRLQQLVTARASLIDDENLLEKVLFGLEELEMHVNTATTSLASGEIDAAEGSIIVAFALVNDLDQLTLPFVPNDGALPGELPEESGTSSESIETGEEVEQVDPESEPLEPETPEEEIEVPENGTTTGEAAIE